MSGIDPPLALSGLAQIFVFSNPRAALRSALGFLLLPRWGILSNMPEAEHNVALGTITPPPAQ